jgi:hypothetical protein
MIRDAYNIILPSATIEFSSLSSQFANNSNQRDILKEFKQKLSNLKLVAADLSKFKIC